MSIFFLSLAIITVVTKRWNIITNDDLITWALFAIADAIWITILLR